MPSWKFLESHLSLGVRQGSKNLFFLDLIFAVGKTDESELTQYRFSVRYVSVRICQTHPGLPYHVIRSVFFITDFIIKKIRFQISRISI